MSEIAIIMNIHDRVRWIIPARSTRQRESKLMKIQNQWKYKINKMNNEHIMWATQERKHIMYKS